MIASMQNSLAVWESAKQHSSDICNRLALDSHDLDFIQRNNICCVADGDRGFLSFVVSGKEFRVFITHVADPSSKYKRERLLQTICINDNRLNKTCLVSTPVITSISEEWHALLLKQLPDDAAAYVREKISALRAKQVNLWQQARQRSADICRLLEVSKNDLERIKVCLVAKLFPSGSFEFELHDKKFRFTVDRVCGCIYGGSWECLIQAACTNDASLNTSTGGGTTLVTVIDEKWHHLFMQEVNRHLFDAIKKCISDATMSMERLWQQVLQHSDDISVALHCSKDNNKALEDLVCLKQLPTTALAFTGEKVYSCTVENKEFAICRLSTYCGSSWVKMIQVICLNDASLNQSIGGGTSFVNVITESWHQKLVERLKILSAGYSK